MLCTSNINYIHYKSSCGTFGIFDSVYGQTIIITTTVIFLMAMNFALFDTLQRLIPKKSSWAKALIYFFTKKQQRVGRSVWKNRDEGALPAHTIYMDRFRISTRFSFTPAMMRFHLARGPYRKTRGKYKTRESVFLYIWNIIRYRRMYSAAQFNISPPPRKSRSILHECVYLHAEW